MGYQYELHTGAKPFVPGSITFPKKKAKELKSLLPALRLSEAQSAVAVALGWKDWFALEHAISIGTPPSALDEDVAELEALRRYGDQFHAILALNVWLPDVEHVVAELGLTCSTTTAKKRLESVGPWGAFQSAPETLAPGLEFGECAKFWCYRLSKELHDQMPAYLRRKYSGWYMADDHEWRVVLAFPQYFSSEQVATAREKFANSEPYEFEVVTGEVPSDSLRARYSSESPMALLRQKAQQSPSNWFALGLEPFSMFDGIESTESTRATYVVSAIRGSDILAVMENKGVWPENNPPEVRWVGMSSGEVDKLLGIFSSSPALSLNGLKGWDLPPMAAYPFADAPFADIELDLVLSKRFMKQLGKPTVGPEVVLN